MIKKYIKKEIKNGEYHLGSCKKGETSVKAKDIKDLKFTDNEVIAANWVTIEIFEKMCKNNEIEKSK